MNMEKIELCYKAPKTLELVAEEEFRKLDEVLQKIERMNSLSVATIPYESEFSFGKVISIRGGEASLKEALRTLYNESGMPTAITQSKVFGLGPTTQRAIEISEEVMGDINPQFNANGIYVSGCKSLFY